MDPQIPSEPTIPPPAQIPQQMITEDVKTNHRPIFIIIVTVILLAIITSGIYLFTQRSKQSTTTLPITQTTPNPTTAPQPTVQVDETAGWTTYQNTQTKFTFKHPSNWMIGEGEGCSLLLRPNDTNNYWICFRTDYEKMDSLVKRMSDLLKPTSEEKILVGGRSAIRLNNLTSSDKTWTSVYVDDVNYQGAENLPEKKVTLDISFYHLSTENLESYKGTFDQILSTIKFE